MYWPSMIPQPTVAPIVIVATTIDMHGVSLTAGVLVLIAMMTLGLAILGMATRD